MGYARLGALKTYLGIDDSTSTDDVLLEALLTRATAAIENHTGRIFEAATETRYFELGAVEHNTLTVDKDLLTVTTLTNGDSSATVIPSTEYWLTPRNSTPKHGIRLKVDSLYYWEQDTDCWVSVAGTWGYSADPPADIVQACTRLAAYYYAQKDAQVFDTTANPQAGVMIVPQGIPRDVELMLGPYVRVGMA